MMQRFSELERSRFTCSSTVFCELPSASLVDSLRIFDTDMASWYRTQRRTPTPPTCNIPPEPFIYPRFPTPSVFRPSPLISLFTHQTPSPTDNGFTDQQALYTKLTPPTCNIPPRPFLYPSFPTPSVSRPTPSTSLWTHQTPSLIGDGFAGPSSSAPSDEILEWFDDESHFFEPSVVYHAGNDGRAQYQRNLMNRSGVFEPSVVYHAGNDGRAQYQRNLMNRSGGNRPKPRTCRNLGPGESYCPFCLSNGETENVYKSHPLRDQQNHVICPVLRKLVCSACGATGQSAHTRKYCPLATTPLPRCKPIRLNAAGKRVISYN